MNVQLLLKTGSRTFTAGHVVCRGAGGLCACRLPGNDRVHHHVGKAETPGPWWGWGEEAGSVPARPEVLPGSPTRTANPPVCGGPPRERPRPERPRRRSKNGWSKQGYILPAAAAAGHPHATRDRSPNSFYHHHLPLLAARPRLGVLLLLDSAPSRRWWRRPGAPPFPFRSLPMAPACRPDGPPAPARPHPPWHPAPARAAGACAPGAGCLCLPVAAGGPALIFVAVGRSRGPWFSVPGRGCLVGRPPRRPSWPPPLIRGPGAGRQSPRPRRQNPPSVALSLRPSACAFSAAVGPRRALPYRRPWPPPLDAGPFARIRP